MDSKEIEYFETVYEEKSINRAAKKLYITPQGLGRILKKIEAETGTPLFERTQNGLIPTQSAHIFHAHAADLIRRMEHLTFEMQQYAKKDQILRIGCANGVFHIFPLRMIRCFNAANPDIQTTWQEYNNSVIPELILDHKLDYGCIVGKSNDPRIWCRPLTKARICVLVYKGHTLFDQPEIDLDMLKNEELLTMGEQFKIYHDFISACKAKDFLPNIIAKTMDGGVLFHLCAQKLGLGITPDFKIKELWSDSLRAIPLRGLSDWEVYGICLEENKAYPTISFFDQYLNDNIGNTP